MNERGREVNRVRNGIPAFSKALNPVISHATRAVTRVHVHAAVIRNNNIIISRLSHAETARLFSRASFSREARDAQIDKPTKSARVCLLMNLAASYKPYTQTYTHVYTHLRGKAPTRETAEKRATWRRYQSRDSPTATSCVPFVFANSAQKAHDNSAGRSVRFLAAKSARCIRHVLRWCGPFFVSQRTAASGARRVLPARNQTVTNAGNFIRWHVATRIEAARCGNNRAISVI